MFAEEILGKQRPVLERLEVGINLLNSFLTLEGLEIMILLY